MLALYITDDVEAIVLDPCYKGTAVETAAHRLPCVVEWHDDFRLSMDRVADCELYRGRGATDALSSLSGGGIVTSFDIGTARVAGMDNQLAKWTWHCVARFGTG